MQKQQTQITPCLDWSLIDLNQHDEELTCSICLQMMTSPFSLDCSHTFGYECINKWIQSHHAERLCPLCRNKTNKMIKNRDLSSKIRVLQMKCPHCSACLLISNFRSHLKLCQVWVQKARKELKQIVKLEVAELQKEITPHLSSFHPVIFRDIVKNWIWLAWQPQDWKWWWWCNQPWWQKKGCPTCNELWHKYQFSIEKYEARRVDLIKLLQIKEQLTALII